MSYIKPALLSVLLVATSQISFGPQVTATASAQEREVLIPRGSETTLPPAPDIRIFEPDRTQIQEFEIVPRSDGFASQIPDLDGEPTIPDQQPQQLGNSAVEAASRLRNIVQRIDPNAELLPNGATFRVQNIPVTLVYDINADRMRLISPASSIDELDADSPEALFDEPSVDREAMLKHWTKDALMSAEARAAWLEPDIAPLPWAVASDASA